MVATRGLPCEFRTGAKYFAREDSAFRTGATCEKYSISDLQIRVFDILENVVDFGAEKNRQYDRLFAFKTHATIGTPGGSHSNSSYLHQNTVWIEGINHIG